MTHSIATNLPVLSTGRLTLKPLAPSSEGAVQEFQAVFRRAQSFIYVTQGRAPTDADAERLMKLLPPQAQEDDKLVLGVYVQSEIVGCATVVRAYPKNTALFIGLLLISEQFQRRSIGAETLRHIESLAISWGHDTLEIVVDSANERGHAFWVREGFTEQSRKRSTGFVGDVIVMERRVVSSSVTALP